MWNTTNASIISVDDTGLATAHQSGEVWLTAETLAGPLVKDSTLVVVGDTTVANDNSRSGIIRTTSSYVLRGDFTLTREDNNTILSIESNYKASTALPGLYVYLSNNPSSTSGAMEIQKVEVFEGAHTYELGDVGLDDYTYVLYFCKPFNVEVGNGRIE